jgi:secreted PhoX family phosphatase
MSVGTLDGPDLCALFTAFDGGHIMPNGSHDTICNTSSNKPFQEVVDARVTRRGFLGGGIAAAATATVGGVGALLDVVPVSAKSHKHRDPLLGFQGIPVSSEDAVVVPPGYTAAVLIAWGDPVSNGPAFKPDASNTAAEQAQQWGMHNDGVVYFPLDRPDGFWDRDSAKASEHGLLVQNNEYTDDGLLFPDGTANWTVEKTRKSQHAHGVSVVEIRKERRRRGKGHLDGRGDTWRRGPDSEDAKEWKVVRPSRYARRLTARTLMKIGGPLGQWNEDTADSRMITSADPTGRHVLGTINNCAMGFTPWGTYLACEENFNGYFRKTGTLTQLEKRYGVNASGAGYLWHTTDARFNANVEPNEAHRFGWVVEFDPFNPHSTPVKRTALGRLKHEGAWVQEARDGRLVVYMGDDEQFEYIYRYVSNRRWRSAVKRGINPLDDGILYVARFNDDGSGDWLPLVPGVEGLETWSLNDILINTRTAADLVGATPMDRPEWIDTFPEALTVVGTLTNNSNRGIAGTNPRTDQPNSPIDAANPRGGPANPVAGKPAGNPYGHIIRWKYAHDFSEPTFYWDIFALGGDPTVPGHGSTINGDKFGSPDGIYVAPSGRLWIQTDVSASTINAGAYAGFGNNQMLCADPTSGEVRRFLVGPNACEITGVFTTPDERTMFVGIQHPGEPASGNHTATGADPKAISSWPDGDEGGRPRSSCIVITKDDGGPIGS